jgi:hypothetical protein
LRGTIGFEAWMPTETWRGRYLQMGCGGHEVTRREVERVGSELCNVEFAVIANATDPTKAKK